MAALIFMYVHFIKPFGKLFVCTYSRWMGLCEWGWRKSLTVKINKITKAYAHCDWLYNNCRNENFWRKNTSCVPPPLLIINTGNSSCRNHPPCHFSAYNITYLIDSPYERHCIFIKETELGAAGKRFTRTVPHIIPISNLNLKLIEDEIYQYFDVQPHDECYREGERERRLFMRCGTKWYQVPGDWNIL